MLLQTERLTLAPVCLADADRIRALASREEIARQALHIPHPFEEGMAEAWISSLGPEPSVFAIRRRMQEPLIGIAGLVRERAAFVAELSYWVGHEYWGHGYATEAASRLLAFGFDLLKLDRIFATTLGCNVPSKRVLEKIGLHHEGCLRRHVEHWGEREDLHYFGILSEEYHPAERKRRTLE